jgi:hypothetical protein
MPNETLQEKVDQFDAELSKQLTEIVALQRELAALKEENSQLKDLLGQTVILAQRIFIYRGVDKISTDGDRLREDIRRRLQALHTDLNLRGDASSE